MKWLYPLCFVVFFVNAVFARLDGVEWHHAMGWAVAAALALALFVGEVNRR